MGCCNTTLVETASAVGYYICQHLDNHIYQWLELRNVAQREVRSVLRENPAVVPVLPEIKIARVVVPKNVNLQNVGVLGVL